MKQIKFNFEYSSDGGGKGLINWMKHNVIALILLGSTILGGGGYLLSHWVSLREEISRQQAEQTPSRPRRAPSTPTPNVKPSGKKSARLSASTISSTTPTPTPAVANSLPLNR